MHSFAHAYAFQVFLIFIWDANIIVFIVVEKLVREHEIAIIAQTAL